MNAIDREALIKRIDEMIKKSIQTEVTLMLSGMRYDAGASVLAELKNEIQSGAFDAEQIELQRLRAALCELEEENRKLRKELDLLQELAVKVTVEREKERKSAQQETERLRQLYERERENADRPACRLQTFVIPPSGLGETR